MLISQNISYLHPDKDLLFNNLNFTVRHHDKIALIGKNGSGKSSLLKLITGELKPADGQLTVSSTPYLVPQHFGQYNHLSIAQALQIEGKFNALSAILNGSIAAEDYAVLNDDWAIESRCNEALQYWQLTDLELSQKLETLSGGQKTKVFLAGISIHNPKFVLLDEPSNHLDYTSRQLLYNFIKSTQRTLIVVSHDRKLLNLLNSVYELTKNGIIVYGGNYDFYAQQKQNASNVLNDNLQQKEKTLRKAKEKEKETSLRRQKLDARGKGKQETAGVARIMMNTLKNKAQKSTSKLKNTHSEKINGITLELQELRSTLPDINQIKFGFGNAILPRGKIQVTAKAINFGYNAKYLWPGKLNFQIRSGERLVIKGKNGSGKTTLIKLILGSLTAATGEIDCVSSKPIYIDQDYSLVEPHLKVYEQALIFNNSALQEHEIKIRLHRFLFTKADWEKPCQVLSGGEKMRLLLCCLTLGNQMPDLIILDEPTNNLDIQNTEILINALNEYEGTLIVVSHDEYFMEKIGIQQIISL